MIILGGVSSATLQQRIESFEFSDGTVLDMEAVLRSIVTANATPGDDIIDARLGLALQVEGGAGDDLIYGEDGTSFVFKIGDGSDIVDTVGQAGSSQIVFAEQASFDANIRRVDLDGPQKRFG